MALPQCGHGPISLDEACQECWAAGARALAAAIGDKIDRTKDLERRLEIALLPTAKESGGAMALRTRVGELEAALRGVLLSADASWEEGRWGHDWPEACVAARAALAQQPDGGGNT